MPIINLKYKRIPADATKHGEGFFLNSLTKSEFLSFNKDILGLGDLNIDGKYINALSAFFDLQGFTEFCNQIDSHLVIPEFLKQYLDWLFSSITKFFTEGESENIITIWGSLPFYAKFLGDGILFLWDTDLSGGFSGICNIVLNCLRIQNNYAKEFAPKIKKRVSKEPKILRCGISRGQVISIGNGQDFVGSCINVASRLQKTRALTFALSRRGFDNERRKEHSIFDKLILKRYPIRGIGDDELIWILKDEYENLPDEEKQIFIDP